MHNFRLWEMDCWDGYKKAGMKKGKGGKPVNNCVPEDAALCENCGKVHEGGCDEGDTFAEMGPAAMKRAKRRKASLDKAMKKYGDAEKMGMNPADVNQRRNKPTLKKR